MEWTLQDQEAAKAEGWLIAKYGDKPRIERCSQRFNGDAAAVAFVGIRASLGHILARKAFEYLAWCHAVEDAARQDYE